MLSGTMLMMLVEVLLFVSKHLLNLNNMTTLKQTARIFFVLGILISCNSDEENPVPPNEEELITTISLDFIEEGTTDTIRTRYRDIDGEGPITAEIDNIELKKGKTYNLNVNLLNETDPLNVVNLTNEIEEEAEDHQFFFQLNPSSLGNHIYKDVDDNGRPIGIKNIITTGGTSGIGILKITLKHQPNLKSSTSDITIGETDIEVEFNLTIQD